MNELQDLQHFFTFDRITPLVFSLVRVLAILFAAVVAAKIASRFVLALRSRIVLMMRRRRGEETTLELEKRAATIGGIIHKALGAIIWAMAISMALREVGFDVAPILAGAGVVGLAVGFGAQNLVRDVITGLFMLMENQISVNDVAVINGTGGAVEEINLRTTVLRSADGAVHIFPNGAITSLSNLTREFSFYVFDITTTYKDDPDKVIQILTEIAEHMRNEDAYRPLILEPLDVMGVDKLGDANVLVKARIKTIPGKQWTVGREMNRRLKMRFEKDGIVLPAPKQKLYYVEGDPPFRLQMDDDSRESLKKLVREVLAETQTEGEVKKP